MSKPVYKTKTPITIGIDNEIYEKLKAYSEETMIPQTRLINKALQEFLDKK